MPLRFANAAGISDIGSHVPQPARTSITDVTDPWPTLDQIVETLTLRAGANTNTVIVGTTLLGLAAGIIGVFALLRKRSLMTDALSHATLPGITLAFLVAPLIGLSGRSLPVLLTGAAVTGVLGVICIHAILRHTRLREDAAIGIVLSVFFGAGVVGLSYIQTNAASGAAGLGKLIYGQTAAMQPADAALMAGIAVLVVATTALFFKGSPPPEPKKNFINFRLFLLYTIKFQKLSYGLHRNKMYIFNALIKTLT